MALRLPIFMDHHSTTPIDPRVLEAMLPYFTEKFGNASSRNHAFGWEAEEAVEQARRQIARLIRCEPKEVVFTCGATESNNLALKGVTELHREKGGHLITARTEHRAVLDPMKKLEKQGFQVTYLPVDKDGLVSPDEVRAALTDRTFLISIMLANNEIGTIQPIEEIGRITQARGVLFHCDATQGVGKIPVDLQAMGLDLMSFSAHKIYGPKGVGALYVRARSPRVRLAAQIEGGGHERGMRSGTLPVPLIVGFGKACEICEEVMPEESARLTRMRDRLQEGILSQVEGAYGNGHPARRLPHNLNLSFARVEGESLLMGMQDVALSSGSACTSASLEPSHVLSALGVGPALAHASIRYGLGRFNTDEEVDFVIGRTIETVNRLRKLSPVYDVESKASNKMDPKGDPRCSVRGR